MYHFFLKSCVLKYTKCKLRWPKFYIFFHLLIYCKNIELFEILSGSRASYLLYLLSHPVQFPSNDFLSMPAHLCCLGFNFFYLETILMTVRFDLCISITTLIAGFTCLSYHLSQLFNDLHESTHSPNPSKWSSKFSAMRIQSLVLLLILQSLIGTYDIYEFTYL